MGIDTLPVSLVSIHAAIQLLQFFFEKLKVWVYKAQLQRHSFFNFLISCNPTDTHKPCHDVTMAPTFSINNCCIFECRICSGVNGKWICYSITKANKIQTCTDFPLLFVSEAHGLFADWVWLFAAEVCCAELTLAGHIPIIKTHMFLLEMHQNDFFGSKPKMRKHSKKWNRNTERNDYD